MPETIKPEAVDFDEAIAFFRDKTKIPTERWNDLWQGMHARAFTSAGAMKAELLSDLYTATLKGLTDGISLGQFKKAFDETIARHGWNHVGSASWRSALIFNTNMRTAYMAGRFTQMTDPDVLEERPFWMYDAVDDMRTRPQHAGWDGLILRHDDPFWKTHYPPNGWGCRCRVRNLRQVDLDRRGLKVGIAPDDGTFEWTDKKTGKTHQVPVGIDPGWDYNVGEAAWGERHLKRVMDDSEGKWIDLDPRGPSYYGRPEKIPALKIPLGLLGPKVEKGNEPELRKALRAVLDGDEVLFVDPSGETLLVNQGIVNHMLEDKKRQDGREAYFPLIPDLIENPYEIWVNFVQHEKTGQVALRKRYINVIEVGKKKGIGLVAEQQDGAWQGLTFFRGDVRGLKNARKGRLLYGK